MAEEEVFILSILFILSKCLFLVAAGRAVKSVVLSQKRTTEGMDFTDEETRDISEFMVPLTLRRAMRLFRENKTPRSFPATPASANHRRLRPPRRVAEKP